VTRPGRHSGGGNRRRGLALGAVAAALLVLVAGVAVHMHHSRGASSTPQQPPGLAAAPHRSPTAAERPGGQAALGDSQVGWRRTCGVDLPETRHGPRGRDGERRYGFARDAAGAVVAAAHLVVQVSPQVGPDVFAATLAEQVTGPDTDALVHAVHGEYVRLAEAAHVPYGQPICPIYARLVGFLLDSHTPHAASLRLLVEGPGPDGTPRLASLLVQLSWADGDWRLVAPPLGDWSRMSTLLPATAADAYQPLRPGE
jgi:hypothetical protein